MGKSLEDIAKEIWEHRITAWILGIAAFITTCIFMHHSPTPGIAIAVLGGVAAIMSIRHLTSVEKFFWILMSFGLIFAEIRAIRVDRSEQIRHQLEDRKAQDLDFKGIRDVQDNNFKATAQGLQGAIQGIQSTLKAANTTLIQTKPYAAVQVTGISFADGAPSTINSGVSYPFNLVIINKGNEAADIRKEAVRIYTGTPDDPNAQDQIAKQFEKDWVTAVKVPSSLLPQIPVIMSRYMTFSPEDIAGFSKRNLTVYFLYRVEYSDSSGRWRSQECEAMQNGPSADLDFAMFHYCSVFRKARIAVTKQP